MCFQPYLHAAKDHQAQLPCSVCTPKHHRAGSVLPGRCHQDVVYGHRHSPAQQRDDCRDGLLVRYARSHVGTPYQDKSVVCSEILHLRSSRLFKIFIYEQDINHVDSAQLKTAYVNKCSLQSYIRSPMWECRPLLRDVILKGLIIWSYKERKKNGTNGWQTKIVAKNCVYM